MKRVSVSAGLSRLIVVGLAALGMSSAHALLINDDSDDFQVAWAAMVGTNVLSAHASFDVTSVTANQIVFTVNITNTSVLTTMANAGLASFGLQTEPEGTSASIAGASVFQDATIDNIPGLSFINLCVWAGNNCSGGPQNQLLAVGASDAFTLTLNGDFSSGLNVLDSGIKFQTSAGSFEFPGTECAGLTTVCQPPPLLIPEPHSLALLGLGLLALVVARVRRA